MVGRNYGLRGLAYVGRILIPAAFPEHPHRLQDRLGVRVADADRGGARVRRVLGLRRPGLVHLREQEPARDPERVRGPVDRDHHRACGRERDLPHASRRGQCAAGACRAEVAQAPHARAHRRVHGRSGRRDAAAPLRHDLRCGARRPPRTTLLGAVARSRRADRAQPDPDRSANCSLRRCDCGWSAAWAWAWTTSICRPAPRAASRSFPATGANALAVAEYVIAAALVLLARRVFQHALRSRRARWPRAALVEGRELCRQDGWASSASAASAG